MEPKRKPNESYESYVERVIREAQEEGAFERLPGVGKPLPYRGEVEEGWWIKEKMRRERLSDLPASISIRHEAEAVLATLERESDERIVRQRLVELNARIRRLNATWISGPPTTLAPLDVEDVVERWRARRCAHQHR